MQGYTPYRLARLENDRAVAVLGVVGFLAIGMLALLGAPEWIEFVVTMSVVCNGLGRVVSVCYSAAEAALRGAAQHR
jgi:hypothetical protein